MMTKDEYEQWLRDQIEGMRRVLLVLVKRSGQVRLERTAFEALDAADDLNFETEPDGTTVVTAFRRVSSR